MSPEALATFINGMNKSFYRSDAKEEIERDADTAGYDARRKLRKKKTKRC